MENMEHGNQNFFFEKLSQDFQHLNAERIHKLQMLETLKKVHLQMCSTAYIPHKNHWNSWKNE